MRILLSFFFCWISVVYSQAETSADSISYYRNLSNQNKKENNYQNAIFYATKAINFGKVSQPKTILSKDYFNLGVLLFEIEKHNEAIEAFSKSVALFETKEATLAKSQVYYYLGLSFIKIENFSKAEQSLNQAKSILTALNVADISEKINLQLAIINLANGNNDAATHLFRSIIAKPDFPQIMNSKAVALYEIGKIEAQKNRYILAVNYFEKALKDTELGTNSEQKSAILLALSEVHDKMLDKSKAYTYLKQHLNLKESLELSKSKKLGIDEYNKYKKNELKKESETNLKLAKEKLKDIKIAKIINLLAISLIFILSLLSVSLYKNNIIRNKTNTILKEKNTELEIAQETAEKASRARAEFLSIVSHELRTPLNAINGITHLLLEGKPKKNQLDYLSSLKFSGHYLTTFINDILEVNTVETNSSSIEESSFDPRKLLINITTSLTEIALQNNTKYKFEIDSDIPKNLIGDTKKLSQIFINLVNNALKFTKNGSVTVLAKLVNTTPQNVSIHFEIIDTGIGIPEDKHQIIFDNFTQGSIEINRKYGGTGLGLTIVKKTVELLGSTIHVESTVGKGSVFSFDLDFKIAHELQAADISDIQQPDLLLTGKTVLLVEDNKINQMISRKMLEKKGIQCEIIDNGEEAIEILKTKRYDLVLMDVHLPGINGTVATAQIRKFNKTVPIIALTAISLSENRESLLDYGMNEVISKPFNPKEFYSIISHFINLNTEQ